MMSGGASSWALDEIFSPLAEAIQVLPVLGLRLSSGIDNERQTQGGALW